MSRPIMLFPVSNNIGLTSIIEGLIYTLRTKNVKVNKFKPINTPDYKDKTLNIINSTNINKNIDFDYAKSMFLSKKRHLLLTEIVTNYENYSLQSDVILIEGLVPKYNNDLLTELNYAIASTLNVTIVFVSSFIELPINKLKEQLEIISYKLIDQNQKIAGIIINNLNKPLNINNEMIFSNKIDKNFNNYNQSIIDEKFNSNLIIKKNLSIPILGYIPRNIDLIAPRIIDIVNYLKGNIINEGEITSRKINSILFCVKNINSYLNKLSNKCLLCCSAESIEVIISIIFNNLKNKKIGGLLITDHNKIQFKLIKKLCNATTIKNNLPIFSVKTDIWNTVINIQQFNTTITTDYYNKFDTIKQYIINFFDQKWIKSLSTNFSENKNKINSSIFFCYQLIEKAKKNYKKIILPESYEPRIIKAANICANKGIAQCVMLGNINKIHKIANMNDIILNKNIKIIDPIKIRQNYISRLIKIRKNKGMNEMLAKKQLEDNIILGTLMLEQNKVDGLVAGAINSTANTIRPALQIIKTIPNTTLVSSIFFMLMPNKVIIFGDCAININPNAEQIAEIAIQSANSAYAFGINPKIALISYSTGQSGKGYDIDQVKKATNIVKQKRPELIIDGPLQYDTAIIPDVAKDKAPKSIVAGKANVLIFPNLNTGNAVYKAVQRAANIIAIGPILQGLNKPVNDLSRGSLVDDIVYTIAVTAIQASYYN